MVRLSTVAVSTLVPALNVRSTTLPDSTFLSVVRTNAPPLPGLTCWNSTTVHRLSSRLSTRPFFRSLVVAMWLGISLVSGERPHAGRRCGGRGRRARSSLPAVVLAVHVDVARQPFRFGMVPLDAAEPRASPRRHQPYPRFRRFGRARGGWRG